MHWHTVRAGELLPARAVWIGFSLEQLAVLQGHETSPLDWPTVILRRRLAYVDAVGRRSSPTHSSYITLISSPCRDFGSIPAEGVVIGRAK